MGAVVRSCQLSTTRDPGKEFLIFRYYIVFFKSAHYEQIPGLLLIYIIFCWRFMAGYKSMFDPDFFQRSGRLSYNPAK